MKRDFLRLADLDRAELIRVLDRAAELKRDRHASRCLVGRSVALIFEKPSTRTRVSFEVGVYELGGHPVVLSSRDMQLGRGESIEDTARTLSGYVHAIVLRTFGHEKIEALARSAKVPVINALTDEHHPCQILADLQTVREVCGRLDRLRYVWVGDSNNVARSWGEAAKVLGLSFAVASPKGFGFVPEREDFGPTVTFGEDLREAVKGADVVITDVWASMGQEGEAEVRKRAFEGWSVEPGVMSFANEKALVLHCLPAHRGEEIDAVYLDGDRAVVWSEAENRLHAQKALMEFLLK